MVNSGMERQQIQDLDSVPTIHMVVQPSVTPFPSYNALFWSLREQGLWCTNINAGKTLMMQNFCVVVNKLSVELYVYYLP